MKLSIRAAAALLAGATLLAACGDKGGTVAAPTPTTPTPPATVTFQSRFGAPFANAFNASATAEPVKPAATDVPPLSLTTEPLDN